MNPDGDTMLKIQDNETFCLLIQTILIFKVN